MPNIQDKIARLQNVSLMDLLVDQCADLEALLALAKREVVAAEKSDFRELISVVAERATLGERLESYHRQIAELRGAITPGESLVDPMAVESVRLAVEIQVLDARASMMLMATRKELGGNINRLNEGRKNFVAYLRNGQAQGLSCDRQA